MTQDHPYLFEAFSFQYPASHDLFKNFSLSVPRQRWLGILGPSGVGKSTLLHALAQHLQIKEPGIRVALLPQVSTLLPWLSILNNVLVGDLLRRKKTSCSKARGLDLLRELGLTEKSHCLPRQLSGGECQRVIIARTIYEQSDIILMDEPFASLDAITKQEVQNCAQKYFKDKTVVLVTHDPLEGLRLCHQLLVLKGKPVHYDHILQLHTPTPRQLDSAEMTQYYDQLMQQLLCAKRQVNR